MIVSHDGRKEGHHVIKMILQPFLCDSFKQTKCLLWHISAKNQKQMLVFGKNVNCCFNILYFLTFHNCYFRLWCIFYTGFFLTDCTLPSLSWSLTTIKIWFGVSGEGIHTWVSPPSIGLIHQVEGLSLIDSYIQSFEGSSLNSPVEEW